MPRLGISYATSSRSMTGGETGGSDMTKVMFALFGVGTLALVLLAWIAR